MSKLKEAKIKLKENNKLLIKELQNTVEVLQANSEAKSNYIQTQKRMIEIQEKLINALESKRS